MRRAMRCVVLAALLATGGLALFGGGASSAAGAPTIVVCPLAGSVTCCGPPIVRPTATAAACISFLSLVSNRNPSRAGSTVTLSGHASSGGPGISVTLWEELPGQTSYHQAAQTTTDSSGNYTLKRKGVQTDRAWYTTAGTSRSPFLAQAVTARVSIVATSVKVRHGLRVVLTGSVGPSHAGERVRVQQRHSGSWSTLGSARLDRHSRYAFTHRFAGSGTIQLRISLAGDRDNAASLSRVVTVTL
jgi:hypothetical protein